MIWKSSSRVPSSTRWSLTPTPSGGKAQTPTNLSNCFQKISFSVLLLTAKDKHLVLHLWVQIAPMQIHSKFTRKHMYLNSKDAQDTTHQITIGGLVQSQPITILSDQQWFASSTSSRLPVLLSPRVLQSHPQRWPPHLPWSHLCRCPALLLSSKPKN